MKKLCAMLAMVIGAASIIPSYALADSKIQLSVPEAIAAIWKLNYKDTQLLHELFFPKKEENKDAEKATADQITQSVANVREALAIRMSVQKALEENQFGDTTVTRIVEAFATATAVGQGEIKKAIFDSHKEYSPDLNAGEAIVTLLFFPFSIFALASKHLKHVEKIEAQRAGLSTEVV